MKLVGNHKGGPRPKKKKKVGKPGVDHLTINSTVLWEKETSGQEELTLQKHLEGDWGG